MRSISVGLVVVTALALLGIPGTAVAQQDTLAGPRLREAFASVPEGRTVKVLRASGTTVGQYGGIVGDSLALRTSDGPPVTLALDSVQAAWSRKHQSGRGALIGGIAGVALGVAFGLVAQSFCESESSGCGSAAGAGIVGGLAVGAVGAGMGALIGAAIPVWKPLVPQQ
jgi:hypothetical protein